MKIEDKPIVAAFDFDKTLTYQDTLIPFLMFSVGKCRTLLNLLLIAPFVLGFFFGLKTRQQVKERLLTRSFKGYPIKDIQEKGKQFVDQQLSQYLKPEGIEKLKWHQGQQHRSVLVSANLSVFLVFWAEKAGFNDLICSVLEENVEGKATGKIVGNNCWGEEKIIRLQHLLQSRENIILYAYGDSLGDKQLLDDADYAFYRSFVKSHKKEDKKKP